MNIQSFYEQHLSNIQFTTGNWMTAQCPFHDDTHNSFSFETEHGNWICHAGCGKGTIKQFCGRMGIATPDERSTKRTSKMNEKRIAATYDYHSESGELLFQAVRYEPKEFSLRQPDGKGGWIKNIQGVETVPYNLPQVITSDTVYFCEGEKDCESLKKWGLTATTNPMGAGKWKDTYNRYFKDKNVIILPDNDKPGKDHAEQVARNLSGTAHYIKIVTLPELPDKGDVSDWIQSGHTREELQLLIATTPECKPLSFLRSGLELQQMTFEVSWLIDKLIPENAVTLLHGAGGSGKTYLAMQIGEAIFQGVNIFGLTAKKVPVFYIDFENPLIVEIDRSRKLNILGVQFWHPTADPPPPKIDANNWELIKLLPKDSVLIVDTLRACQLGDENSSKDMAFVMNRFKELRDKGYTIILLHHTMKSDKGTYKGSTAILDLADHVLSLTKVKKGKPNVEVSDDDEFADVAYRFGTKEKTRFEPYHIFMQFDPANGFSRATDPDDAYSLSIQDTIRDLTGELGEDPNQTQVLERVAAINEELSKQKVGKLLKKGEGKYWMSKRDRKNKNALVYQCL